MKERNLYGEGALLVWKNKSLVIRLVMWVPRFIVNKLQKMSREEKEERVDEHLFSSETYDAISRCSHFVDVPHVRQLFNWDCGLACVLMVLKTLGIDHCDIHDLEKLCCSTSIWTVDLAYLLHEFSVSFSFLTVTLGANPDFAAENFYKEQLQDDLGRVDGLFEKALETGINIQCRSISGKQISVLILSGKFIAIALVDKVKLSGSWLKDFCASDRDGKNSYYMGHFVIICGYDVDAQEFEIRDPASPRKHERVSVECLEEARKSFGTDEDILLVSLTGQDENSILLKS